MEQQSSRSVVTRRYMVRAADGAALSVLVALPPDHGAIATEAPPVLALHGFASSASSGWGRTGHLAALIRAGRVIVAPDLRGHGSSDKPHEAGAYTLDAVLDDVTRVAHDESIYHDAVAMTRPADAPDAGRWDLLGYSLGARLAWTMAQRRQLSVRRMVLGGFDGRPLFDGVDTERLDRLAAWSATNDRVALRALVAGLAGTGGTRPGEDLPAIPTLIAAGDRDPLATRAGAFVERLPQGELLSIPRRDHVSAVPSATFRSGVVRFLGHVPD